MQRFFIFLTCFTLAGLLLQFRDVPKKTNTFTVYINFENHSVRANVLYEAGKIKSKMGHIYYWYANNDIKKTDGGFDGKLLHGEYKSFYRNMNLKEQGSFSYGLKDGAWKSWYEDGKIHELGNYKKGKEQGEQAIYDAQGNIVSKTNFKKGIKQGKTISYQNGKVDTIVNYKKGEPEPAKRVKSKSETQKNKLNDSTKSKISKTNGAQDTIAKTPKSSFIIKKIFHKKKAHDSIASGKNKQNEKKENPPKNKSKTANGTSPKKT